MVNKSGALPICKAARALCKVAMGSMIFDMRTWWLCLSSNSGHNVLVTHACYWACI
jgi:hypothetical protein